MSADDGRLYTFNSFPITSPQDRLRWLASQGDIGTPLAEFTMDIQAVVHEYATTESHLDGFDLPDPIAMAVALEPECAVTAHHHVEIGIGDGHDRGKDIVDWLGSTGQEPNTEVAITVDRDRFVGRLRAAVGG